MHLRLHHYGYWNYALFFFSLQTFYFRRSNSSNRSLLALSSHLEKLLEPSQSSSIISLRNALVPGEGNLYLSADYSQLELRILAHLSQDSILMDTLKIVDGDVFKGLAARYV